MLCIIRLYVIYDYSLLALGERQNRRARIHNEEFTRLAETRLAQNNLNCINIAYTTFKPIRMHGQLNEFKVISSGSDETGGKGR